MANLVDMKRTAEDKKKEAERYETEPGYGEDDYGYGLTIRLDNEMIEKLGIEPKTISAETPVMIMAEGRVSEESANTYNGKTRRTLAIQIQKLAVAPNEGDAAKVLYNAD